jgi:SAM-dependent methyltransferase
MTDSFSPITFEEVACDQCGSRDSKFLFRGPDRLHGFPGEFSLVQCTQCGWIRQDPRPVAADLGKFYPRNYGPYANAIEDEKWIWNGWDRRYGMLKRRRSVERFSPKGKLLEVGCGTGVFLHEMQRGGWSVVGIEPNEPASAYARSHFSADVRTCTLEEFKPGSTKFDVICLWNVLEHLPAPSQDLRRLCDLLQPGGLLVMSIPNMESLDRKLFGESWLGWDLPRHLYLFPKDALEESLAQSSMSILSREAVAGSYACFLISLQLYLHDRRALARRPADAFVEFASQFPVRILTFPAFWLLDTLRLSPILTYYIRKD